MVACSVRKKELSMIENDRNAQEFELVCSEYAFILQQKQIAANPPAANLLKEAVSLSLASLSLYSSYSYSRSLLPSRGYRNRCRRRKTASQADFAGPKRERKKASESHSLLSTDRGRGKRQQQHAISQQVVVAAQKPMQGFKTQRTLAS